MDSRVRAVSEVIEQRPWVCLSELARSVALSPSRLQHLFAAGRGVPLGRCARAARLAMALHLLAHSDMSVKQVQAEVAYASPSAFCRAFKAVYGVSPRRFRQLGGRAEAPQLKGDSG